MLSRREVILASSVALLTGGCDSSSGKPAKKFSLPPKDEYDLLYYSPKYRQETNVTRIMPQVGHPIEITGGDAEHVRERDYTIGGNDAWQGSTAYLITSLDDVPGELVCYFRTGKPALSVPTMAVLPDSTGRTPFLHLQLNSNVKGFIPQLSYNAPPLISKDMHWTTQNRFDDLPGNAWLIYRVQIRRYEARLTVEATDGRILGECYAYSGNLPRYLGRVCFFELFGSGPSDMVYGFLGAKSPATTNYNDWARTGVIAAETMQTAPDSGIWGNRSGDGGSGAGASYDPSRQAWTILGTAPGTGTEIRLGAVSQGDSVDFWGNCVALQTRTGKGAAVTLASDRGLQKVAARIASPGDFHLQLVAETSAKEMSLIVGSDDLSSASQLSLQDVLVTVNKNTLSFSLSNPR